MSSQRRLIIRLTLERWALIARLKVGLWRMRAQVAWGMAQITITRAYIRWLMLRGKLPSNSLRMLDQQARFLRAQERQRTPH